MHHVKAQANVEVAKSRGCSLRLPEDMQAWFKRLQHEAQEEGDIAITANNDAEFCLLRFGGYGLVSDGTTDEEMTKVCLTIVTDHESMRSLGKMILAVADAAESYA